MILYDAMKNIKEIFEIANIDVPPDTPEIPYHLTMASMSSGLVEEEELVSWTNTSEYNLLQEIPIITTKIKKNTRMIIKAFSSAIIVTLPIRCSKYN